MAFFIHLYCHILSFFCIFFTLNYLLSGRLLIYFACPVTRYLDVGMNPGPRAGVPARSRIMIAKMRNLDELAVAASHSDRIFCCETSTDGGVYDYLLESMDRIQSEDRNSAVCFFGDFSGHHSEWLGFSRTDIHGVAILISLPCLDVFNWFVAILIVLEAFRI